MSYKRNNNNRQQTQNRPMYTVTCSDCQQQTQVPFKPDGERPVYCRDCFQKHRTPRR